MNGTSSAGASIYDYESPNQHGTHPYLWTSGTFRQALSPGVTPPANTVVDPFSGVELFSYTDVPTGTWAVGPLGERYQIVFGGSTANRTWMALWNASAVPSAIIRYKRNRLLAIETSRKDTQRLLRIFMEHDNTHRLRNNVPSFCLRQHGNQRHWLCTIRNKCTSRDLHSLGI